MEAYGRDLAAVHDAGYSRLAEAAAERLLRELEGVGIERGLVVDLGCGSGQLAATVGAAGYDVLGIDLAPAMLERARAKAPGARFVQGSALDHDLPPCVAVTAVGEVFNYEHGGRIDLPRLRRSWSRVHRALCPGGLFLLDLQGPGAIPPGEGRLHRVTDDWAMCVDKEESAGRLVRRITTFRREGERWRRSDEVHRQRLLEPARVAATLREVGFRVRGRRGWGEHRLRPNHRAFIARKGRG